MIKAFLKVNKVWRKFLNHHYKEGPNVKAIIDKIKYEGFIFLFTFSFLFLFPFLKEPFNKTELRLIFLLCEQSDIKHYSTSNENKPRDNKYGHFK